MNRALQENKDVAQEIIQDLGRENLIDYFRSRLGSVQSLSSRGSSIEAYARLAGKAAIPTLISIAQDADEPVEVRAVAVRALGRVGDSSNLDKLLDMLDLPLQLLQIAIIEALARIGDARSIEPIMRLLSSADPKLINAAAEALVILQAENSIPRLQQIINTEILNPLTREKVLGFVGNPEFSISDQIVPETPRFVGRLDALKQLHQALGQSSTVIVQGMGGVGKTSLAAKWANTINSNYKFWLSCRRETDIFDIYSALAKQIASQGERTALDYLTQTEQFDAQEFIRLFKIIVGKQNSVLVMDGLDEATNDAGLLTFLDSIRNQLNLQILITSRKKVDLPQTQEINLGGLSREEVVEMIRKAGVTLTDDEIDQIYDFTGGLPLALTLTLSLVKESGFISLEQQLTSNKEDLFRHVIGRAVEKLEKRDVQMLRVLAVFNNPISIRDEKIQLLLGSEGIDAAEEILQKLEAFSLVNAEIHFYTVHPIIRDYFLSSMPSSDLLRLHRKIGDYWFNEDNYSLALLHFQQSNDREKIITILSTYTRSLLNQGHTTAVQEALSVVGAEVGLTEEQLIGFLYSQAELSLFRGKYDKARYNFQRALNSVEKMGNKNLQSQILHRLGELEYIAGNFEDALKFYEQSLTINEVLGDSSRRGEILNNIGIINQRRGLYDEASKYYHQALALTQKDENDPNLITTLLNLGSVATSRGEYIGAEEYFQRSLRLARTSNDLDRESAILGNIGRIHYQMGAFDQSEQYLQEGLQIARKIGHRERESDFLANLGLVAISRGDNNQALALQQEGLNIAREIGYKEREASLLINLGVISLEQNELEQAESYLREGLSIAHTIGLTEFEIEVLNSLGALSIRQGDYAKARQYIDSGLALSYQVLNHWLINELLIQKGELLLTLDNLEEAQEVFNAALSKSTELGSRELLARAQYGLARVFAKSGNIIEAKDLGNKSLALFKRIGSSQSNEVQRWLASLQK